MLFNSFSFLFIFLPLTWCTWRLSLRWLGLRPALCLLVLASLIFYAMWDVRYLPLLLGSIAVNFWLGGRIIHARNAQHAILAKRIMQLGVVFNLVVLGTFKYSYFIASSIASLWQGSVPFEALVLPLAISFVTFQKIAYLVDCERGVVNQHDAIDYLFFVSFFPQLIAGPIVHHRPLIAQARNENPLLLDGRAVQLGLVLFSMGLFKKVMLADSLARFATPVFKQAQLQAISTLEAWQAALAYSLQLYFDFSGYSDMAIGLALLFGFKLPRNFHSPYCADSIIEFWRRWHMSLSQFLRDYVYVPLGGNRDGSLLRYRNIGITMILGGIWHGAGWTFIVWGALHAGFILCNHVLRDVASRRPLLARVLDGCPGFVKILLTFILVVQAWVVFRAPDMATAWTVLSSMWQFPTDQALLSAWSQHLALATNLEAVLLYHPGTAWVWIGVAGMIVWCVPNSLTLIRYDEQANSPLALRNPILFGLLAAIALWFSLKWMAVQPASEFLYFNF